MNYAINAFQKIDGTGLMYKDYRFNGLNIVFQYTELRIHDYFLTFGINWNERNLYISRKL